MKLSKAAGRHKSRGEGPLSLHLFLEPATGWTKEPSHRLLQLQPQSLTMPQYWSPRQSRNVSTPAPGAVMSQDHPEEGLVQDVASASPRENLEETAYELKVQKQSSPTSPRKRGSWYLTRASFRDSPKVAAFLPFAV